MSDPTTVNQTATLVNKALLALEQVGVDAAMAEIVLDAPFFGLPVIKDITEGVLSFFGKYVYKQAALTATKIIIDMQTDLEASGAQDAFDQAQKAIQSGDQNAINKASKDLDDAFSDVIHFDGSATP